MLELIYHYIMNPKKVMASAHAIDLSKPSFIVILLTAISTIGTGIFSSVLGSFSLITVTYLGSVALLFITAVYWDFIAQIFGKTANSRKLFHLIAMTTLPSILVIPLSTIMDSHIYGISLIASLLNIATFFYILYLQIQSIKFLYQLTNKQAALIFFSPLLILLIPVLFGLLIAIVGIAL